MLTARPCSTRWPASLVIFDDVHAPVSPSGPVILVGMTLAIPSRGKLIVLEGLDRAGKSTQCRMFCDSLTPAERLQVALPYEYPNRSRESVTGRVISNILSGVERTPATPEAFHLLFVANRWEHVGLIRDMLDMGRHVICVRYSLSGMAYAMARGADLEWCRGSERGLPVPDHTFYFNVSAEEQQARRGWGAEVLETTEMQARVRAAFERAIAANGVAGPVTVVDASGSAEVVLLRWANVARRVLFG